MKTWSYLGRGRPVLVVVIARAEQACAAEQLGEGGKSGIGLRPVVYGVGHLLVGGEASREEGGTEDGFAKERRSGSGGVMAAQHISQHRSGGGTGHSLQRSMTHDGQQRGSNPPPRPRAPPGC